MNRDEMLAQLGLSSDEFNDLMQKYAAFVNSLDANQKAIVAQSLPTMEQAAASFGPEVTPMELQSLFLGAADLSATVCFLFIFKHHPHR